MVYLSFWKGSDDGVFGVPKNIERGMVPDCEHGTAACFFQGPLRCKEGTVVDISFVRE